MHSRPIYAILGVIIGAVVDLLINLIATGIQQHAFPNPLGIQVIWGLAGLALAGLLIGLWLGGKSSQTSTSSQTVDYDKPDTVTMTRLQAFWSHNKLKGRGIHIRRIFLFKSTNEVNTD